jgi:hypothetical protein
MDMIVCHAYIDTSHVLAHRPLRLGHEPFRGSCGHPLAVFVEHTEEAIINSRLTVVIPFLSMTSYLIGIVELKG